jgi:hypothetical protein
VKTAMNFRAELNIGKFLSSCATGNFSIRAQLHGVTYVNRIKLSLSLSKKPSPVRERRYDNVLPAIREL